MNLGGNDDAEVVAAPFEGAEQVVIIIFGRGNGLALGGNEFKFDNIIAGPTVSIREGGYPNTKHEASNRDCRDTAVCDYDVVLLMQGLDIGPAIVRAQRD